MRTWVGFYGCEFEGWFPDVRRSCWETIVGVLVRWARKVDVLCFSAAKRFFHLCYLIPPLHFILSCDLPWSRFTFLFLGAVTKGVVVYNGIVACWTQVQISIDDSLWFQLMVIVFELICSRFYMRFFNYRQYQTIVILLGQLSEYINEVRMKWSYCPGRKLFFLENHTDTVKTQSSLQAEKLVILMQDTRSTFISFFRGHMVYNRVRLGLF